MKTDILVYADWKGINTPTLLGVLTAQAAKGKKTFSFRYDSDWLKSKHRFILDPDVSWVSGSQYADEKKQNFGVFFDSMPDTWGRTLMKRRAQQYARETGGIAKTLYDVDFLLGIQDSCRMGGLRFKLNPDGEFLADDEIAPIPPISSVRELQHAAEMIEMDDDPLSVKKWLEILMAPGSSLGGARPKANVVDERGELFIAKFPSKGDSVNKAAWEYLAYRLALQCGLEMAESRIERISGKFHTFFTKRFDREKNVRIHFSSAMTMTGYNENILKDYSASYLDVALFVQNNSFQVKNDLQQLWRRIVFNIAISNTDDHLRNHGFLLTEKGWKLSPAYDLNPSIDKDGLSLNIDAEDNSLDFELAKSVGEYFYFFNEIEMDNIIQNTLEIVSSWRDLASEIGISRSEQELMSSAFRIK